MFVKINYPTIVINWFVIYCRTPRHSRPPHQILLLSHLLLLVLKITHIIDNSTLALVNPSNKSVLLGNHALFESLLVELVWVLNTSSLLLLLLELHLLFSSFHVFLSDTHLMTFFLYFWLFGFVTSYGFC